MAESEPAKADIMTIQSVANEILTLEERRQETFQSELEAFENGEDVDFEETMAVLQKERSVIESLEELLAKERDRIEGLEEAADYLRTDQAVRNRDAVLDKLREHNRLMDGFCGDLKDAINVIESNVDSLRSEGANSSLEDPQEHLARAYERIDTHNECIEGLDKNLRILNTYLS